MRYGDEWMPNIARDDIGNLERRIAELQEKASAAGRGEIPVSGFAAPRDQVAARIERYAERAASMA